MDGYAQNTCLSVGQEFLHYSVQAIVGQGAMGIVYKVYDKKREMHVALKILHTNFISEKQHRKFAQEVKAIAKLNHENIVKLFDVGTKPMYYFTMEYVAGKTLAQMVVNNEDVDFLKLGKIMHKIAIALYHAHVKGIIHGDIKPQNIVIDENDEPKIMDFGLAKNRRDATHDHTSLEGTPAYLSPEQLQHKEIDKRSDIYSLGVTLYYCLTKQLPFAEKNYAALFYQIVHRDPQKPREINADIPRELEEICLRCIQRNAQLRYANTKFLAHDLAEFVNGKPLVKKISQKINKNSHLFYIEILLVFAVIILAVTYYTSNKVLEQRTVIKTVDTNFSWHNRKSEALLPWYRMQKYHMHNLQLLLQRIGFGDQLWQEDTQKAIASVYDQIHKASSFNLELAVQLIQAIIMMQNSEYIDQRFSDLCATALKVAKKRDLRSYIDIFEQFDEVYKVSMQLRMIERNDLQTRYKKGNLVITAAMKKITNPYGCFYLACHSNDIWVREKLLLDAVSKENNYRFYSKLGEFYINNHLYHEGIAVFRHQLQDNPYEPVAHYYIAQGFISIGEYESALLHLRFLEKHYFNKGKELIFLEKTRIFTMQKKYSRAKKALEDARKWISKHGSSMVNFEFVYNKWHKFIVADPSFESGFSANKMAGWYYRIGELEKAYKLIDNAEYVLQFAIYRAILEKKLREFDTADHIWKEAYDMIMRVLYREQRQKAFVYSPLFYRYALEFLIGRRTDFYKPYTNADSKNMQLLDSVGKALGQYYFVPLYRAHFMKDRGAFGPTVALCNKAKQLAPWYRYKIELIEKIALARWYYYYNKNMSREYRIGVARKMATEMVRDHNYGPAHNLLGASYIGESISKARNHFAQIVLHELSIPDLLDFYYDSAHFYAQVQDYERAINYMERYLKLDPNFLYAKNALQSFRKKRGK